MSNAGELTYSLQDRYSVEEGQVYLSGLQALIRLLLDQRRRDRAAGLHTGTIVSGYPGSPVGGLDVEFGRQRKLLDENDIWFLPGLNEDLAATAVFGTQLMHSIPGAKFDGAIGMWYGKAPGVDRTMDAFRHGQYRGVSKNGGILAVAGDDPEAKTSILPSDSLPAYSGLMMPSIYPADIQDVLDLGLHGYEASRASGLAVGLKLVTDIADSAGTAFVGPDRIKSVIPQIELDGKPFSPSFVTNIAGPPNVETERNLMHGRLEIAREYGRANRLNSVHGATGDAEIGLVAAGKTYLDMIEALRLLGIEPADLVNYGIRVMKVGMPYPLHADDLRDFAKGLQRVVVFEEKRPFIEAAFKEALYYVTERPEVVGKTDGQGRPVVPDFGALHTEVILPPLAAQLDALVESDRFSRRVDELHREVPTRRTLPIFREGHFCSGCPHTTSLKTPDNMVVGGGIGCHTMAVSMDREQFGDIVGFTQMGGEGAQWIGATPFTETDHFIQNIGDGTFAHSGSLALRFAVAAGAHMTYKLLFNSAVAMTGGQDVAGGKSVVGTVELLLAEGVKKIIITTEEPKRYRNVKLPSGVKVRDRDEILDVQRELAEVEGVTVLLHDQQCAIEKRRSWKRDKQAEPEKSVYINERVCEGCGDCGEKSSCLSVIPVSTEFGRKTQIHRSSCTKDYSCLQGDCPSFLTVIPGKQENKSPSSVKLPKLAIEVPPPACPPEHFELHMSGIGGTGVITVNQILGTAAAMGGSSVQVLDRFGGSQKAGAVTSNLKVSSKPAPRSNTIADGSADVLLVFDVLVASEPQNLAKADPTRTIAVASTHKVPTGSMIVNPRLEFPETPVFAKAIDANTRADQNIYLDAQTIAERLLGNHLASNLFLAGVAYQKGLIPLPLEHIEHAITLNGVAVQMNLEAFGWGRMAVAHPEEVERALATLDAEEAGKQKHTVSVDPKAQAAVADITSWADDELRSLLERRVGDLIDYQSVEYARRFADAVRRAQEAAERVGGDQRFAIAVATGLYKLMAYKDEYEVARLHLDAAERARISREFGENAKVYWHLHPPALRALGMERKLVLGPWFAPVFRGLRGMRKLRGTAIDPFGHAKVRKVERELIGGYETMVREISGGLTAENLEIAIELAGLPDLVRGYEEIKLANVERYETRRAELESQFHAPSGPTPKVISV